MDLFTDTDTSLIQGSDSWKAARRGRIGGSDIAVIMRISPYKTRLALWEEKTGRVVAPNIGNLPHVQRGIRAEPIARDIIEKRHQVSYTTPVLVHPEHDWAVASLDGLCDDHTLEIKTMSLEKHLDVRDGVVPDYYVAQVLWGLMIANRERGLFASYRPEDKSLYETWIERDRKWEVEATVKASDFINWVRSDTKPPDDFVFTWAG